MNGCYFPASTEPGAVAAGSARCERVRTRSLPLPVLLLYNRSKYIMLSLWLILFSEGFSQSYGLRIQDHGPRTTDQESLRTPKMNKRVLLNGLPVFAIELPQAQTAVVHLLI